MTPLQALEQLNQARRRAPLDYDVHVQLDQAFAIVSTALQTPVPQSDSQAPQAPQPFLPPNLPVADAAYPKEDAALPDATEQGDEEQPSEDAEVNAK